MKLISRQLICLVALFYFLLLPIAAFAGGSDTVGASCCRATHTHGMYWLPKGDTKAVLLCVHGLGLCADAYQNLGERMSARGVATYAVDVRGFGPYRNDKLDLDGSVVDIEKILDELQTRHPDKPIFLLGESMGGSIAIKVAAVDRAAKLSGLICSAPAWRIYRTKRTYLEALLSWISHRKGKPPLLAHIMIDEATTSDSLRHHFLTDNEHRLDLTPSEALRLMHFMRQTPKNARSVTLPVLMVQGLKDRLVRVTGAPRLFHRMPTDNKELVLVAGSEHLVFEEGQCADAVLDQVTAWISQTSLHTSASIHGVFIGQNADRRITKLFQRAGIRQFDCASDGRTAVNNPPKLLVNIK